MAGSAFPLAVTHAVNRLLDSYGISQIINDEET